MAERHQKIEKRKEQLHESRSSLMAQLKEKLQTKQTEIEKRKDRFRDCFHHLIRLIYGLSAQHKAYLLVAMSSAA